MKLSVWSDGSSPVYLNPTQDEILELARSRVDTLRICEEPGQIALASGFGNTHGTVVQAAQRVWGNRWSGLDLILFRLGDEWRWNPLGHWPTQSERVEFKRGLTQVEDITRSVITDFVSYLK